MSSIEIVPWICREEWEFCRDNLFGEDLIMKKKAVEHLHIWKTRCPNLQLAVECTLVLMDTYLQGLQCAENVNPVLINFNSALMYSMAVTKFVNYVTDSSAGYRPTNSLHDVAKELNIPPWIIDLRHRAAHDTEVPKLELLQQAVDVCLKWLYDNYWAIGDFEDAGNLDRNSFKEVESCLDVHRLANENILLGYDTVSEISDDDRSKIYRQFRDPAEMHDEEKFNSWTLNEISKTMLKKLSKIIKKDSRQGELLVDKLLKEDILITRDTLNDKDELDETSNKWSEILSVLCLSNSCHYLLRNLIVIIREEMELPYRKKCAAIYVNEILKSILLWKNAPDEETDDGLTARSRKKRKSDFKQKKSSIKLELRQPQLDNQQASDLLKFALAQPNIYITVYLKNLLKIQDPPIDSDGIDKMLELINIYIGTRERKRDIEENEDIILSSILGEEYEPIVVDESKNNQVFNVLESQTENESNEESNTVWKKCSGSWKWGQTPFGTLPWQEDFKPWLKLYQT